MKKDQIRIGETYLAKVSSIVPVRLDADNQYGGWEATNLATNKKVRVESSRNLRGPSMWRPTPRGTTPDEADLLAAAEALLAATKGYQMETIDEWRRLQRAVRHAKKQNALPKP